MIGRPWRAIVSAVIVGATIAPQADAQQRAPAERYTVLGCAACHGQRGEGTATGPGFIMGSLGVNEFTAYLRRPAGTMPSYAAEAVSDDIARDLYEYLARTAPGETPTGRVETGAEIYRSTGCFQCHANEGQGGAQGPKLGPDPISFPRFTWYVRHPTGSMPPYTHVVMSNRDLADIYAFLAARPRPPEVDRIPLLAP